MTFLAVIGEAGAQGSQTNRLTKVKRTNSRIVVDGLLDDSLWNSIPVVDSFINKWPTDNGKARLQTQVRIAYDEQFIYFGIKAFLKRESRGPASITDPRSRPLFFLYASLWR